MGVNQMCTFTTDVQKTGSNTKVFLKIAFPFYCECFQKKPQQST